MNDTSSSPPKPVQQAVRFADSLSYNAWSALHRAQQLLSDAREIETVLAAEREQEDGPLRPWFGFEIVSYYIVGFATCLEWHVRTRLADLYAYRPEAIDRKALEGRVSSATLTHLIAANVTIPHYLSASITVGSADEVFLNLDRVFQVLGIKTDAKTVMQPGPPFSRTLWGKVAEEPPIHQTLEALFKARHALVHEVGTGRQGSFYSGGQFSIAEVLQTGRAVLDAIQGFEKALAQHAPRDFPNLLDARFYPVDELARLRAEVDAVTDRIADKLASDADHTAWAQVQAHANALSDFIRNTKAFRDRNGARKLIIGKLELQRRRDVLDAIEEQLPAKPD